MMFILKENIDVALVTCQEENFREKKKRNYFVVFFSSNEREIRLNFQCKRINKSMNHRCQTSCHQFLSLPVQTLRDACKASPVYL